MIYLITAVALFIWCRHMLYINKTTERMQKLRHNNYHLQRSREYFNAFLETGDKDYLDYSDDELKKVRY